MARYRTLRRELEGMAGRINGRYAEFDWTPIRYLNKPFPRQTLAGFYRTSRVGLVTPVRDGMNLVAKEYVAAQDPHDPGVLVLSRFAGAARELKSALIVNPYDIDGTADALQPRAIDAAGRTLRTLVGDDADVARQHDRHLAPRPISAPSKAPAARPGLP